MLPTALRKAASQMPPNALPAPRRRSACSSWPALGALAPLPAFAVINGEVSRDPDGLRASVVRIESTQGEICSGTLIARDLVLTAAHCVMHQAGYSVVAVDRAFRQRRINAIAAAMHPDFVPGTTPEDQPGIDLALIKLAEPLGADFQPLDPRGGAINTGDAVDIAGFGVVAENRRNTARHPAPGPPRLDRLAAGRQPGHRGHRPPPPRRDGGRRRLPRRFRRADPARRPRRLPDRRRGQLVERRHAPGQEAPAPPAAASPR